MPIVVLNESINFGHCVHHLVKAGLKAYVDSQI